jgi:hypothetical protein
VKSTTWSRVSWGTQQPVKVPHFFFFKCGRFGNALDLWAAANPLSIYDAALDLCQRLNVPLPLLPPQPSANREEEPVATGSSTCTIP